MNRFPFVTFFVLLSFLLNSSPLVGIQVSRATVPSDLPTTTYTDYVPATVDRFAIPRGQMSNEEVRLQIYDAESLRSNGPITFTKHIIANNFDGARSAYAADIDSDGDIDVLGAARDSNSVSWWENDGSETFTAHIITNDFTKVSNVFCIDVDSDGDIDVLGAAHERDDITWWENDGNENFTEHTIADNFDYARWVYAVDMDGDEDIDVLGAASNADDITWWENDGSENFTEHIIADNYDGARSVYAADVDGDGDVDVLGAAAFDDDITWWENDGSENFTEHTIADNFKSAKSVYAIDLDGDGDTDVLGAAHEDDKITWWENGGSENFVEHTIASSLSGANCVYATDMDGDRDVDVLASAIDADAIAWWENDGSESFTKHIIDNAFDGAQSAYAIDIDSDGDIDVVGSAASADDIAWYENNSGAPVNNPPVAVDDLVTTIEDSATAVEVLVNDYDVDGDPLTVVSITQPLSGAATINLDDTVTYTPTTDWHGVDAFAYTISDDHGGLDSATVTVTVSPANDPPVAADDYVTTTEGLSVTVDALANDYDVDGDALAVISVTHPLSGTAGINPDYTITYTPTASMYGTDSFTYTISDGQGGLDVAVVRVVVIASTDCELYPIALHVDTLTGVEVGEEIEDIYNGGGRGNFGWLSWTGAQGVPTLAHSLTPPGDSDTYINPDDPEDRHLSIDDWVRGRPGVGNAKAVRNALDALMPLTITLPVWDVADGQGANLRYHVVGFAQVQITDFRLPGQNRISAIFWGMTTCPEPGASVMPIDREVCESNFWTCDLVVHRNAIGQNTNKD